VSRRELDRLGDRLRDAAVPMRLSRVQDIVGARVARDRDLAGQDSLVMRVTACFPDHRVRGPTRMRPRRCASP